MKIIFCLITLIGSLIYALSCDPNGNNKPLCTENNINKPIRNFWDPSGFWFCTLTGAQATMLRCPPNSNFDGKHGVCVTWNEWTWTPPCYENKQNNSIACLRAKAQEHQARLLNSGLFLQVRSFADLQQRHQQHQMQLQQGKSSLSNNLKICDIKSLAMDQQHPSTQNIILPVSKREIL